MSNRSKTKQAGKEETSQQGGNEMIEIQEALQHEIKNREQYLRDSERIYMINRVQQRSQITEYGTVSSGVIPNR